MFRNSSLKGEGPSVSSLKKCFMIYNGLLNIQHLFSVSALLLDLNVFFGVKKCLSPLLLL